MPKARILAVDDQLYFRVYLHDLLVREGYDVDSASGPDDALQLLETGSYDLVLTDLVMPGVTGTQFVEALARRDPDQDIVVVTSVGDVRTAVDAMKVGATDYLVKPIEAEVLGHVVRELLARRRIRREHARLVAENIEFMGAFSLYERALGLFEVLSPEALADRIAEGLCLETRAHGGVVWLAEAEDPARLRLVGARGLVRPEQEAAELRTDALPAELAWVARGPRGAAPAGEDAETLAVHAGSNGSLLVPLRHGDALLGLVRLSDKLDGGAFGEMDRAAAGKFAAFAAQAVANALRFRSLERRSFRDPITRAYTAAYLEDIVRNEIQKASRFGRSFSLVRLQLEPLEGLRRRWPEAEFAAWLEAVASQLGRALRATDQLASESADRFCAFLPETHAVGAGVLKYRMRAALERAEALTALPPAERPAVLFAAATFPVDGSRFEVLRDALDVRIAEHRASLARRADLGGASFRQLAERLLADARPGRPETAEQAARFLFSEIAQRPEERGLLFVSPGAALAGALRSGLERVRGLSPRTEIVLLADRPTTPTPGLPVTWVTPLRAGTSLPFLVYYGEGPSYALLRDDGPGGGRVRLFHTSDRALVEELAFGLGRDLGIPIGESA